MTERKFVAAPTNATEPNLPKVSPERGQTLGQPKNQPSAKDVPTGRRSREETSMSTIDIHRPDRATMPKTLFGYDVVDFIGQGAGSSIYAFSEPPTNQIYALKHVVR